MVFSTLCGTGIELSEKFIEDKLDELLKEAGFGYYVAGTLCIDVGKKTVLLTMQKGLPANIELLLARLYVKHKSESAAYFAYANSIATFGALSIE